MKSYLQQEAIDICQKYKSFIDAGCNWHQLQFEIHLPAAYLASDTLNALKCIAQGKKEFFIHVLEQNPKPRYESNGFNEVLVTPDISYKMEPVPGGPLPVLLGSLSLNSGSPEKNVITLQQELRKVNNSIEPGYKISDTDKLVHELKELCLVEVLPKSSPDEAIELIKRSGITTTEVVQRITNELQPNDSYSKFANLFLTYYSEHLHEKFAKEIYSNSDLLDQILKWQIKQYVTSVGSDQPTKIIKIFSQLEDQNIDQIRQIVWEAQGQHDERIYDILDQLEQAGVALKDPDTGSTILDDIKVLHQQQSTEQKHKFPHEFPIEPLMTDLSIDDSKLAGVDEPTNNII